jgi:hypothetical protein
MTRPDRATLLNCHWPGATDNHISFSGNAYGFIDVIMPFLSALRASTHAVSNHPVRVLFGTLGGGR